MKFSSAIVTAIAALSATVFAAEAPLEKKQAPSPFNTQSAYLVLATALPSSLVSEAITNPGAVSSEIAADFSQGSTPSWFSALPTDVKSYLQDQGSSISRSASATVSRNASSASASALPPRPSATGMLPYGTNGTSGPFATGSGASSGLGTVTRPSSSSSSSTDSSSMTTSSSSGSSSAGGASGSGSPSGAGAAGGSTGSTSNIAALPTAAIGAGIGAAVGFFGMLAL